MEIKCACEGNNLDRFVQPVILSILLQEPASGYAVVKQMRQYVTFALAGPDPTGIYRYLKIMEQRGLIEGREEEKSTLYHITVEGYHCLASWVQTLDDYAVIIAQLAEQLREGLAHNTAAQTEA